MEFRWNAWNLEHATRHGVSPEEAERVVASARRPYPQYRGDGKWLAVGRGFAGEFVQVVYLIDPEVDTVYVIHARPLTEAEKRRHRRRSK